MRRLVLLIALLAAAAAPGAAYGATTISKAEIATGYELIASGTDGVDAFTLFMNCPAGCNTWEFDRITSSQIAGDSLAPAAGCNGTVELVTCVHSPPSEIKRVRIATFGGNDHLELTGNMAPADVNAGPGADTVFGGIVDDNILRGGDGDDALHDYSEGGNYRDQFFGDGGNDDLTSWGPPGDILRGGDGVDTARFGIAFLTPQTAFTLTLDGEPNDGRKGPGATAFLASDIENLDAGPLDDTLVGSDAANRLRGFDGSDTITGGGGADDLQGGDGGDSIQARDGVADTVDCGAGADGVIADRTDSLTGCEIVDVPPDVVPPPPPPPEDLDGDDDGIPRPADCRDDDASTRPGAPDPAGDGLDQDCSGADSALPRLDVSIQGAWLVSSRATRFTRLEVRRAPAGATATLRCTGKGKGCPFSAKRRTAKRAGTLKVTDLVSKARLKGGATLELRVTAPGTVGRVARWSIRTRKTPKRADLCLVPGAAGAARCG